VVQTQVCSSTFLHCPISRNNYKGADTPERVLSFTALAATLDLVVSVVTYEW